MNIDAQLRHVHGHLMYKKFPYHSVSVIHRKQDIGFHVYIMEDSKHLLTDEITGFLKSNDFNWNIVKPTNMGTRKVKFIRRNNKSIIIEATIGNDGRIKEIINPTDYRFPYQLGESYHRNIENWAEVNMMEMEIDGHKVEKDKKFWGVKTSDISKSSPLRLMFPSKFR